MSIVEIKQVTKSFVTHTVLDHLDMNIGTNQIFGLLGPNGAGKTTLMRLVIKIMNPDSGTILYKGEKFTKKHVRNIGYMPEERGLYRNMKVKEQLEYIAKLYGLDKKESGKNIQEWLHKLGLTQAENRFVGDLSKGMSQKVQFIATVMHNPELLILDEPFSGLDPISSQTIEKEIIQLKNSGVTIVLSTHRMDQIENFCDNAFLIDKGKKVVEGKVWELKNKYKEGVFQVQTTSEIPANILSEYEILYSMNNLYQIRISDEKMQLHFIKKLFDHSVSMLHFNEILPSMQQVFIKLVSDNQKKQAQPNS